jgi:hypothetical protein
MTLRTTCVVLTDAAIFFAMTLRTTCVVLTDADSAMIKLHE